MNLFQQYLAEEFAEDYQEGRLSRREALKLIGSVTGSVVVAESLLAACVIEVAQGSSPTAPSLIATASGSSPATGRSPQDPSLAGPVEFAGQGAVISGLWLGHPQRGAARSSWCATRTVV